MKLEPICPTRTVAKKQRLFACGVAARNSLEHVPQYRVRGGILVDREVAFEHAVVGSECLDAVVVVRRHCRGDLFR